jgi:DNA polymerase-3 subunit epsilon
MLNWLRGLIGLAPPTLRPASGPVEPFEARRFVVLDLETTGLDLQRDEILALGAIRMSGSRIIVGETFYSLVRAERNA